MILFFFNILFTILFAKLLVCINFDFWKIDLSLRCDIDVRNGNQSLGTCYTKRNFNGNRSEMFISPFGKAITIVDENISSIVDATMHIQVSVECSIILKD